MVIDLETTGLEPSVHQTYELCLIHLCNGEISTSTHFYISHKRYVIDEYNLLNFRKPTERKEGVPVIPACSVNAVVTKFMQPIGRTTFCGKNCSFDYGFLEPLVPGLRHMVGHRRLDVGNMYTAVDDMLVPGLDECVRRAVASGVPGLTLDDMKIKHTALDDAVVTAKLFQGWYYGQIGDARNPTWRKNVPNNGV